MATRARLNPRKGNEDRPFYPISRVNHLRPLRTVAVDPMSAEPNNNMPALLHGLSSAASLMTYV